MKFCTKYLNNKRRRRQRGESEAQSQKYILSSRSLIYGPQKCPFRAIVEKIPKGTRPKVAIFLALPHQHWRVFDIGRVGSSNGMGWYICYWGGVIGIGILGWCILHNLRNCIFWINLNQLKIPLGSLVTITHLNIQHPK